MKLWWQHDPEPEDDAPYVVVLPSGALQDPETLEAERRRGEQLEKSIQARRESAEADRRAALDEAARSRAERDRAHQAELPEHLRGLIP